ncbi:pyridine nucleotide-disulfide oxidoreductase family protein, partial [Vibrio parahaemolyticus EKP-008]
ANVPFGSRRSLVWSHPVTPWRELQPMS